MTASLSRVFIIMEAGVQTLHMHLISLAHIVAVLKNSEAVKAKIHLRK